MTVRARDAGGLYHVILDDVTDRPTTLGRVPLFADLDQDRLRSVLLRSTQRVVTAGSVVATRGQPAEHLIVVETGALTAVYEMASGRRRRLGEFPAPCAVDKTALLDGGGHTATWMSSVRSRLLWVPRAELLTLIDDVPAVRRHVLLHLAGRVRDQQRELVSGTVGDTMSRVVMWLLSAGARNGDRIVLPGAQEGLGEAVGASRVSVNRALGSLAREGLIRTEPGAVTILAPELLARRVETQDA